DSQARIEALFEGCSVCSRAALITVVIWINNSRSEGGDQIGCIGDRHGERLVYAQKCNVYIRQHAQFRLVPGIAAEVNAFAADGQHVTVAEVESMICVIGMHGLDKQTKYVGRATITQHPRNSPLGRA